jgi:hypothetical protein
MIQQYKREADLMASVTQENLNTIALCSIVNSLDTDSVIREETKLIQKKQVKILTEYNKLARENMISVSHQPNFNTSDSTIVSESYLTDDFYTKIKEGLLIQLQLLDSLKNESINKEIIKTAKKNIKVIQSNIKITTQTLETLK